MSSVKLLSLTAAHSLGWANVGFHRPPEVDPREIVTPNVDALASGYMELDVGYCRSHQLMHCVQRHYTYKFCSPSRSSLLSGRLPMHVNIYNDDPAMPGQGVPTNMTMISAKLKSAGYQSHFIGKVLSSCRNRR